MDGYKFYCSRCGWNHAVGLRVGRGQRSGSCCGTILREQVMNHSRHYTTARLGRWLPADPKHLNDWLTKAIEAAEQKKIPFHPVVGEFCVMIENEPEMYMYFTQMSSDTWLCPKCGGPTKKSWKF
jgi:hypothetical protein